MNLILTEIKQLIATEDIKCEASEIYWALPRPLDFKFCTLADAVLLFKGRFGRIRTGEKYLYMAFVDSMDGELLEFSCLACMNKLNFRNGYYPDVLHNALLDYKKKTKEKASNLPTIGR